ncbi:hypothetical protein BEWA_006320 [Theileria equi strain WA]|uniref:Uncharacterized protein n=1 Tax=Theileria equi strain WA TaxID=1537102 RepID=L0B134_THEEQ|nr:hypothetical protein BEWA_006320 [Theileria equi strain WA]AFZ81223.1 hypothetical protein BEWA_006320 [Theileria equi strain WA]|eukprot:XP_004830889.1 hypothetical protein BEWA_006320 [Theileria equi strain WA]
MSTDTLLNGFRVYKDYKSKDSYYRDFRRRKRDLDVIENRFAGLLGYENNAPNYTTPPGVSISLRSECYALFNSLSSDPELLAQFRKLISDSLVIDGPVTDKPFKLQDNGDNLVSLLRFLFNTLSQKYEEASNLKDAVTALKEEQLELSQCLLDSYEVNNLQTRIALLTDEKLNLSNTVLQLHKEYGLDAKNHEESLLYDLNNLSTAYQRLYDEYANLEHELYSANLKNDYLSKRLFDVESYLSMQYFINGLYPPEFEQIHADMSDIPDTDSLECCSDSRLDDYTEIDIFAADDRDSKGFLEAFRFYKSGIVENDESQINPPIFNSDDKYNDLVRKLDEYKKENQVLRIENETLSSQKYSTDEILRQNNAAISGFATIGQLLHQITISIENLSDLEHSGHAHTVAKTYITQSEDKLNVLEYENKAFKAKLMELYEDLHRESSSNFSLQRQLSQTKMELDHAKEAFFNLENLNVVILRNEEELNLLKSNKELYLEQLNSMQNEAAHLNEEKHTLVLKLRTFEAMNESSMTECGVLREEIAQLRAIVNGHFPSNHGIRDKLSKLELESNCKLLEDKLSRSRIEASNLHNTNGQLLFSMMELRRELERERYENVYYSKQISSYIANESKIRIQLDHYTNQIESLTASLETTNELLNSRSAELSAAADKIFEKDRQILSFEARIDMILSFYTKIIDIINQATPTKLSDTSLSILELSQFDTTYYNNLFETIQRVSIKVNDNFDQNSLSKGLNQASQKIYNILNFNYITSTLAISLCKELHKRDGSHINTTKKDNIILSTKELAEIDTIKMEYVSKISELEAQIRELQHLNKQNQKFTWENSIQRITEKYEKSSEELKFMLKECNNLINLNEMALESLRKDNARLLSDHTNAANVIIEYQDRLNSNINERNVLKEVLYSIIPESLREVCDKDDPIGNIKALDKYIESMKLDRNMVINDDIPRRQNTVLDYKNRENNDDYILSNYKDNINRQNIVIDELVSNVDYYYRFIRDNIQSQIKEISDYTDGETDLESPLNVTGKFSDDTIYDNGSDYSDSDYDYTNADDISQKHTKYFEIIIKLLDRLKYAYSMILPKKISDVNIEEKFGLSAPGDMKIIRHFSQLCHILKEITHGTPRQFHLDDIVYQMETLPTSTDSLDKKNRLWTKCIGTIISIATEVLASKSKEQHSELEEALLRYDLTKKSLEEIQALSQIQNKELKKRNTDIHEMEGRIEELQTYCRKIESELENSKDANDRDSCLDKQKDIRACIKQIEKLETIIIELEEVNGLLNQQLESSKIEMYVCI